jgi:hypothetical protein
MNSQLLERVRRLLEDAEAPSRNRYFEEFAGEEGQRVFRLYRIYLSLWEELGRAADRPEVRVAAAAEPGGLLLTVEDPKVAYRRQCLVPRELAPAFDQRLASLGLGPAPARKMEA